jgi:hypothetical protein
MINKRIEYLKSITAYDFLNETETDEIVFNTKVIMSFLMLKFGQNGALKKWEDFTQTELKDLEQIAIDERKQLEKDLEKLTIDERKKLEEEDKKEIEELEELVKELPKEERYEVNEEDQFWLTPDQLKAITKTDKALKELFKAFKKGYTDNLPKN